MNTIHPFKYDFVPLRLSDAEIYEDARQAMTLRSVIAMFQRVRTWLVSVDIAGEVEAGAFSYADSWLLEWCPTYWEEMLTVGHYSLDTGTFEIQPSPYVDGSVQFGILATGADVMDSSEEPGLWLPQYSLTVTAGELAIRSDVVVGGEPSLEPVGTASVSFFDADQDATVTLNIPVRYIVKADPGTPHGFSTANVYVTAASYWPHDGRYNETTGAYA